MTDVRLSSLTSVESVDCNYLTRIIQLGGFNRALVTDFKIEEMSGTSHGGGSLYRFYLTYDKESINAPRTIILKESRDIKSQISDPNYARREADCYEQNLFNDLGTRLYVPKAYRTSIQPNLGQYWVWMEDLKESAFDEDWSFKRFIGSIHDLAELHSLWWGKEEELNSLGILRHRAQAMYDGIWQDRIALNCEAISSHPKAAHIQSVFTEKRQRFLIKLSNAANWIYPKLDALPQTLLHHDFWPPNLGFSDGKTVLIDWSYAGVGTPGADLSQTAALLFQMWGPDLDDDAMIHALWEGLRTDWERPIELDQIYAGYELAICLRPAHVLGAPVLGSILSGHEGMVGREDLEGKLASAEALFKRIERGIKRIEENK